MDAAQLNETDDVAIPPLTVGTAIRAVSPQFLALSVMLSIHGVGLAVWSGSFDAGLAVLSIIGLMCLHIAINVFNDWHDWCRTVIDHYTEHTAFSGGSGMLPRGEITPRAALGISCTGLAIGVSIGLYMTWR